MDHRRKDKRKGLLALGIWAVAGVLMFGFYHKIIEEDSDPEAGKEVLTSYDEMDTSYERNASDEATKESEIVFELEILEKEEDTSEKDSQGELMGAGAQLSMGNAVDSIPKSKEEMWEELLYDIPGYRKGEEYLPDSLRTLYVVNEEARDFVLGYSENIGKHAKIDLKKEVTKGVIPEFLQWDERWGYETYGEGLMAVNACGPTTLSMVYMGLSGDTSLHPLAMAKLAEEKGFYVNGNGSSWTMMKDLARSIGLDSRKGICDAAHIKEQLRQGHPVVCIMGPGDFTMHGHFIVLTDLTEDGKVRLNDSNSLMNAEKEWDIDTIVEQIKDLWFFYGYSEQVKIDYENEKNRKSQPAETMQRAEPSGPADGTQNMENTQTTETTQIGEPSVSGGDVTVQ